MLDIETLSTDSNGVIVSISVVQFDMETGEIGEIFEVGVGLKQQIASGAIMDPDTIIWWLEQSKEAQTQLLALPRRKVVDVLNAFNDWINFNFEEVKDVNIWGNGATFDNVMVRNLYRRHGIRFVLPYWCDKDVRTLTYLNGIDTRDFKFVGTKHNGIADCLHQIKYCTGKE